MEKNNYTIWKHLGFLEGLPENVAIGLSKKYQELAEFLVTYDKTDLVVGEVDKDTIGVLAFPILRKAYKNGLNERYSPIALCEMIEKTFNDCLYYKSALEKYGIDPTPNICAEIAKYFSRNDIEIPKDKLNI